ESFNQQLVILLRVNTAQRQDVRFVAKRRMSFAKHAGCRLGPNLIEINSKRYDHSAIEGERAFGKLLLFTRRVMDESGPSEHSARSHLPHQTFAQPFLSHAPRIQAPKRADYVRNGMPATGPGSREARMRKHRVHVNYIKLLYVLVQPACQRRRVIESFTQPRRKEYRRNSTILECVAGLNGQLTLAVSIRGCKQHLEALLAERAAHFKDSLARPAIPRRNGWNYMKNFQ